MKIIAFSTPLDLYSFSHGDNDAPRRSMRLYVQCVKTPLQPISFRCSILMVRDSEKARDNPIMKQYNKLTPLQTNSVERHANS